MPPPAVAPAATRTARSVAPPNVGGALPMLAMSGALDTSSAPRTMGWTEPASVEPREVGASVRSSGHRTERWNREAPRQSQNDAEAIDPIDPRGPQSLSSGPRRRASNLSVERIPASFSRHQKQPRFRSRPHRPNHADETPTRSGNRLIKDSGFPDPRASCGWHGDVAKHHPDHRFDPVGKTGSNPTES